MIILKYGKKINKKYGISIDKRSPVEYYVGKMFYITNDTGSICEYK